LGTRGTSAKPAKIAGSGRRKLISSAELASLGRVTVRAVNKNPALRGGRVGKLYDLMAPSVAAWLAARGVDVDDAEDPVILAPRSSREIEAELGSDDRATMPLDGIRSMTFDQITERFGTATEMLSWVKARKELAAARRQEFLLEILHDEHIPRKFVEQHTFAYLEALSLTLLRDVPKNLSPRVAALARAGATQEEVELIIRDQNANAIRRTKMQILKASQSSATRGDADEESAEVEI
jgi:hypothetical protein